MKVVLIFAAPLKLRRRGSRRARSGTMLLSIYIPFSSNWWSGSVPGFGVTQEYLSRVGLLGRKNRESRFYIH